MLTRDRMRELIAHYFDMCNAGDAEAIKACFTPDAVHYFPAGAPFGPLVGADAIAEQWVWCVKNWSSVWTVDRFVGDEVAQEAVVEWTHFKPVLDGYLRGDEWYRFTADGLITEVRAYYAAPSSQSTHEIGGYDYAGRGYPLQPPG